jgi:hypothetical protein
VLVVASVAWRHHSVAAQPSARKSAGKHGDLVATAGVTGRGKLGKPRVYTYSIERELDHSPEAFTQGLEFDRSCKRDDVGREECTDILWESTGAVTAIWPCSLMQGCFICATQAARLLTLPTC